MNRKKRKGSLTVEATISFTVFIGFSFLMLTLVKLVLVMTILNNATAETAKTLASSGYVIAIVNGYQENFEKEMKNVDAVKPENLAESVGSRTVGCGSIRRSWCFGR